jgi:hypothetical protein
MANLLLWIGRIGGVVGLLMCLIAVFARARGMYGLAGFQVGTVLLAGMAAMLAGCLGYLAALAERGRDRRDV